MTAPRPHDLHGRGTRRAEQHDAHVRGTRRVVASVVAFAILSTSTLAIAAPKKGPAKKEFDRGVAAYTKGNYAAASAALAKSFKLEADAETLFAWAQTERKLEHCDRAIELYAKLLRMNLPAANKKAVAVQLDECKEILAAQKPAPEPEPEREPVSREPEREPEPVRDPEPAAATSDASSSAVQVRASSEDRAWWQDPVGGALVGVGVVGLGVGAVFFVQARGAEADKATAGSYAEFEDLDEKARSRGRYGIIGLAAGGAFVAVGALWYATRKPSSSPTVTGWLDATGGGFAVTGGF